MKPLRIIRVKQKEDVQAVGELLRIYAGLRNYDEALGDYEAEIASLPGKYQSPEGCLLLAYWEGKEAGCVAFRSLSAEICEMKRLFVLPDLQGKGIGATLIQKLLNNATIAGYHKMRLDSHPWMEAASQLYFKFGFQEIARYNDNPTPGIRFFEKSLLNK